MKKSILTTIAVTALAATLMTGCSKKEEKKVETKPVEPQAKQVKVEEVSLKVWTPENQRTNRTIETMAEEFQKAHPEYKINWTFEVVGEDKAKDEVMKDVDSAADIFFFANDQMVELVNAGALAKLGGSTLDMIKSTMSEAVVGTVTNPNDGAVYGIPFTHNTFFMYYDKSLMSDEDVKSVEAIMNKGTGSDVTNFFFESAGGWKLGAWYYGAGNTIYGPSQADFAAGCDWNNPTGVAVTNYLIDLKNNSKCAFDNGISVPELISNHKLGVWFDGAWNYQMYKDALGDNLGLGVLPTFNVNGNDCQLKGFYGSKAIGVNSHSKALPVAIKFAAFIGDEDMQVKRFKESNQVPTNLNAGKDPAVLADPVASVTVKEAEIASVTQPLAAEFGSRYWSAAGSLTAEIKSGELNKDNAKAKLDVFADALAVK